MGTRRGKCSQPKLLPAGHVCAGAGRTLAGLPARLPPALPFHLFKKTALSNGNTACWAFTHANESLSSSVQLQSRPWPIQMGTVVQKGPWVLLCGCARRDVSLSYLLHTYLSKQWT